MNYKSKMDEELDMPIEYLLKVEKSNVALNEICRNNLNYLHKEIYINWIDKYEYLKEERFCLSFFPYSKLKKFNKLFFKLSQFKFYLDLTEDCIKANQEFSNTDISNEDELIEWLIKVEDLGDKLHSIIETSLNKYENEDEFQTGYVTAHEDFKIKISIADFKDVLEFLDNYITPYWRIYEKYSEVNAPKINKNINEGIEIPLDGKSLYELVKEKKKNIL